jgi:type VI secretion system protein ImpF
MAELTTKERLQPSLLDRLTDDEPDRKQESREQRVLSPDRLRDSVRRDLTWLFNTTALSAVQDLTGYPHAERSTVNYGVADMAGKTTSSVNVPSLERGLRAAIWEFEPRLIRNSVRVKLVVNEQKMSHNAMCFSIDAELWSQPLPMRLYLRTELDLETGEVLVSEGSGAGTQ